MLNVRRLVSNLSATSAPMNYKPTFPGQEGICLLQPYLSAPPPSPRSSRQSPLAVSRPQPSRQRRRPPPAPPAALAGRWRLSREAGARLPVAMAAGTRAGTGRGWTRSAGDPSALLSSRPVLSCPSPSGETAAGHSRSLPARPCARSLPGGDPRPLGRAAAGSVRGPNPGLCGARTRGREREEQVPGKQNARG